MEYIDKNKNIKKLQQKELELLKYLKEICQKNKIEYFLGYGSLLGAVRHKGFIPWDDDVDIFLKGKSYLELTKVLLNEQNDKYFFQTIKSEKNYYLMWNKLRLNNTIFIEKGWEDNNIHKGISIDIFPLIEYPDNPKDLKKISRKCMITKLLLENNLKINRNYQFYGKTGKILSKLFKLIPKKIRNNYANKNIEYLCCYKSKSQYYFIPDEGLKYKLSKECFSTTVELPFEDTSFLCPSEYDTLLKEMYGNYKVLPKEEDRIGHGETYLCFNTNK